jgi:hypothetical protein
MNDVTLTVVAGVLTAVVGGWLVFYLNGRLQRRSDYRQLKEMVDNVAGRGATVIVAGRKYQIESFDRRGLVLNSAKQRVFIPVQRVSQNEIWVPSPEYERVVQTEEQEAHEKAMERMRSIFDEMIDEMLPRIMSKMKDELLEDGGELNAVIGLRVKKALAEDGFTIEKAKAAAIASGATQPQPTNQTAITQGKQRKSPPSP